MIELPILWQFLTLLAIHYIADFPLQTHWQASNKSKNNVALLEHVGVYTLVLGASSGLMFGYGSLWFAFVWVNAVMHYGTDYVTSRVSSYYFRMAMNDTEYLRGCAEMYGGPPFPDWAPVSEDANPAKHWHNFFVVIGFDQLIHQATLAVTLWMIVA